jgi:hypothetical protein
MAAVAGIAVLGACGDNIGKTVAVPDALSSPRGATISSGGIGNPTVKVCVASSSPTGTTYNFVNSGWLSGFENGGTGTTVENVSDGVSYLVPVSASGGPLTNCVTVLERTVPDNSFPQFADTWSSITVAPFSSLGAVYDSTTCIEDVGVKQTDPTPCGPTGASTRSFANIQHGTVLEYFFSPGTAHCAGTIGWFKNQGADLVASWGLFYSSGQTATFVLNDPPKGNAYVLLAEQYIAAFLAVGNAPPVSIASTMASSNTFFTGRAYRNTDGYAKSTLTTWSTTLENFNAGKTKDWPHC